MNSPAASVLQDSDDELSFQLDADFDLATECSFLEPTYNPLTQGTSFPFCPNQNLNADNSNTLVLGNEINESGHELFPSVEAINLTPTAIFPLRQWIDAEENNRKRNLPDEILYSERERAAAIRRVTVAYSIGKLLEHIKIPVSSYSQAELENLCSLDNFCVHTFVNSGYYVEEWEIFGVEMVSPSISLQVTSNSLLPRINIFERKNVEAVITKHCAFCCATKADAQDEVRNDNVLCYAFGVLLCHLFSEVGWTGANLQSTSRQCIHGYEQHRPAKSTCVSSALSLSSTSVSRLVQSLLDCQVQTVPAGTFIRGDPYSSLETAIGDLRLLLQEPELFLFENGDACLRKDSGKLYGRANEVSAIAAAFHRVVLDRKSEACIVGGYSGSGKTRLVQSLFDSIAAADGLLLNKKFENTTSSPLTIVLSAFGDLCTLMQEKYSQEKQHSIYEQLQSEFGTNFHLLIGTIPSALKLAPSQTATDAVINTASCENEVNYFSLCNIIQRFVKVVSSESSPVVIFLDDLQWADSVSLGIIHSVLADKSSTVLFVGTYRDNEVLPTHIIFGFLEWLAKFNIPLTSISIGGMLAEDVNAMVSDSLGIFPRLCERLSQTVFRKTSGSPFYVQMFLRSLVDKNILTYSFRQKTWIWNIDEILAVEITKNVLDLISAKLINLPSNILNALKIASTFGIQIHASIVQDLSQTAQYSNFRSDLNTALEDGLMDFDTDGSFRFPHDKVREAVYEMISPESRSTFHFEIGMALLSVRDDHTEEKSYSLFVILDQINRGAPSTMLQNNAAQRIAVAELNLRAGLESIARSNYISAYNLSKTAISLLPENAWISHNDLCLQLYYLLSKGACAYKKVEEAKDAVVKVVEHADSLQTKLEAYAIQRSIVLIDVAPKDVNQLLDTMIELLQSLGENIPGEVNKEEITKQIGLVMASFERESDHNLLHLFTNNSKDHAAIMQGYNILTSLALFIRPRLYPYYVSLWADFFLKTKVASKHVPVVYANFASILCIEMNETNNRIGLRIGQLGLKILHGNDSFMTELPVVYGLYYGCIGVLFEPLQSVIEMHKKARDVALQLGNLSPAAVNKVFLHAREFDAGHNLLKMKDRLEHDWKSEQYHCSVPALETEMNVYLKAVSCMIGCEPLSQEDDMDSLYWDREPSRLVTQMACLTYFGYFERVIHMAKRWEQLKSGTNNIKEMLNFRQMYVYFYWSLASLVLGRKKKKRSTSDIDRILEIVDHAAQCSTWNFRNKAALLTAEKLSLRSQNTDAEVAFGNAIEAAQQSRFVHEEGLACELAAMHYERLNKTSKAVTFFQQAEMCYAKWGSQLKVDKMQGKIRRLSAG